MKNIKTKNLNYTNTQTFGGFLQYWKLIKDLPFLLLLQQSRWYQWPLFFLKIPFWALIKPLAQFWSIKTKIQSSTTLHLQSGTVSNFQISYFKKVVIHRLLFIPVFFYISSHPSKKDADLLLDNALK